MDTLLQELIVFLKEASPVVWEALMKQVYAIGVGRIVWSLLALAFIFGLIKFAKYATKKAENDRDWKDSDVFLYCIAAMFFIAFVAMAMSAIMQFYNPEYYAIKLILSQLGQ